MTGVLLLTRSVSPKEMNIDAFVASKGVKETDMIKTVAGDRYFAVSTADEAQKAEADDPATADQEAPTYTKNSIPQVTGLSRLSEKTDSLKIGWDEIDGVQGYRIYRRDDNDPESDYKLFSVVNRAGLDIRNLGKGSKYSFRVAPYISDGSKTYEGEPTEVTFGTAPTDVEGFQMTDETKTTISMSWEKNERADGYLMERCYRGKWSDYQEFDADTTEFTDTDLEPGKAYYYRIQAYRDDSTGRLPGAKTAIRTVAGLLGPEDKNSASKLGRVSLDYKDSKYADGYLIYYSKDKEDWEQLTDTDRTHYSTSRLEDGETYWFRIYPYRTVDGHDIVGAYTEMDFVANKEIYDKTVGDTYVEVSLSDQHMWYIVDGDVYLESDCVTGNYGSADTPKGYFSVNAKMSPCTLKGDDYTSYVTYWMPFIGGGWGLHDADWRSSFGGNIYKGNGSHGCVNLPPKIAKEMYAVIEVGTPVIVY
ncbi:MAG: L,D-transpeptidase family protein [Ruminococcus sp.]|nr:L,D-transpeptidase family protein [Ruminococcus sp.]